MHIAYTVTIIPMLPLQLKSLQQLLINVF